MALPIKKAKSQKEMIKELEEKMFGEKNKAKKKEIQGMIKKLELEGELEKKKRASEAEEKATRVVKQLIPVGADPKSVQCINFLNGTCTKGDLCQFSHAKKEAGASQGPAPGGAANRQKVVCRFLIDAMNKGEFTKDWACPIPRCEDIHRLTDLTGAGNTEAQISLEEYIELQRAGLEEPGSANYTPVTEKSFLEWKVRKDKEEELHAKRVAALSCRGADLFLANPEMFEDDEEVGDEIDYAERNYEILEEEETPGTLAEE